MSVCGIASYRERLIDEVKKYPVLYDTGHENHRDIDVRDRCWLEISEKLGENSEVLKREWKSLRDSLRQAVKKTRKGVTTKAGMPCKKWRYQSRMAYIMPFMTNRKSIRHMTRSIKMNDLEVQSDAEQAQQEPDAWDTTDADRTPLNTQCHSLDLFFASLCQSARRLPRNFQNKLKRQVLDVLVRVEDEFENEQSDSKPDVYRAF